MRLLLLSAILSAAASAAAQTANLQPSDFETGSELMAHSGQTVVLDGNASEEQQIRYQLKTGAYQVCNAQAPGSLLKVYDAATGKLQLSLDNQFETRCKRTYLKAGTYAIEVTPGVSASNAGANSVSVNEIPPGPSLFNADKSFRPGFWAIQPNPQFDPKGQHRSGAVRFIHDMSDPKLMYADYGSSHFNYNSLWHFPYSQFQPANTPPATPLVNSGPGSCMLTQFPDWTKNDRNGNYGQGLASVYLENCPALTLVPLLQDLGNYSFFIQPSPEPNSGLMFQFTLDNSLSQQYGDSSLYLSDGSDVTDQANARSTWHVAFRYFPNGGADALEPGEVALFQEAAFQGKAAVFTFNADSPGSGFENQINLAQLDSSDITINETAQSIQVGNNAYAFWTGVDGQQHGTATDLQSVPAGERPAGNMTVMPLQSALGYPQANALDKTCTGCRLQGALLSNVQLEGWTFDKADFSNAKLTNVSVHGSSLSGSKFISATLDCVDFSGTDATHLTDLTKVNFHGATFVRDSSCKTNLSYTRVPSSLFPPASWKYFNLTGAVFTPGFAGQQLSSQAHPLDLSGAQLGGVYLPGVTLDYADLTGTELSGAMLDSASLQFAKMSGATLAGTSLNRANLQSANLDSAVLQIKDGSPAASLRGAYLANANLHQAQIGAADFTDASFYGTGGSNVANACQEWSVSAGCASARNATLDTTNFADAYLGNLDFSNAKITGVNFSNSYLMGANFTQAAIALNSRSGARGSFGGALLQGATFDGANIADGLSFAGAFFDFNPSHNAIYTPLDGRHAVFEGVQSLPSPMGLPVCVQTIYPVTFAPPQTNSTTVCPDGRIHEGGCGPAQDTNANPNWKSPVNAAQFGSYAGTAACNENNANYAWNGVGGQRKK